MEQRAMGVSLMGLWCLINICGTWKTGTGTEDCGGQLTGPRGVISTPNFPNSFKVPIKCRWVIDSSIINHPNGSIIVYLTQLYVYKGLKFTEYAYYESETTNFGGSLIKEVTEGNVFEYRWFKTYRPFLVIDFVLDRLEGNHVRVLHDLLNVYGFNVTYEITEADANTNSCTVRDCSYTGNCILAPDYTTFRCHCFQDFSGDKCSNGPLCTHDQRNAVCRNGGTCKHVGAEAVRCQCSAGYTGHSCEIEQTDVLNADCSGESCILQCPYSSKDNRPCDCKNPTRIYNNRARYECRIKLSNVTSIRARNPPSTGNVESILSKQLAKYLKNSNISTMEDLKILNVTQTAEVTFHFFGNANDGDKIREALNRLVQRRRLSDFALESTHFTFQQKPALRLQSLHINQVNEREVRLGDQFILSCVAQGSYGISFLWYKDDMLVDMAKATREIWYRDLPNDGSDTHTSLLTIDKATSLDTGRYTCQAIDWAVQQCKSIYIDVRDEPDVKVVPMSATIDKGSDIQLMCMTPNMRSLGIGFGWTTNRALIKLEPGKQVWEDLYPAGSILKITNAQKSVIYTCNVAHRSMSVRVEVVNRTLVPICLKETAWGLRWPDTGPGSEALLDCPRHFVGRRVSRLCAMKDATTPQWQLPDFSACLYEPFTYPYTNFRSLTLGYQNTTGSATIFAFWDVLQARHAPLYPGEGDRIVNILAEIEHYQYNIDDLDDLYNSAEALTRIISRILDDEHSILTQQKQLLLQQLTQRNFEYWVKQFIYPYKHLVLSSLAVDIQALHAHDTDSTKYSLQIPVDDYMYPYWYTDRIAIRVQKNDVDSNANKTVSGIVIVYKNMTRFLPSTYVKELDDGTDLEYRFNSRIITVAVTPSSDKHSRVQIELRMRHLHSLMSGAWNVSCGVVNSAGVWDLESCSATLIPDGSATDCICSTPGTFAVFLTSRAARVTLAEKERTTFVVALGCGLCVLQCAVTAIILGTILLKNHTWLNFLKLQCSTAVIGAMSTFIYAVYTDLPESSYSVIAISLESLLLIGLSAPISQALIIYADLTQIRPSKHFQPTVIAVITGVPILAVLSTELTHKSTGWRHESWWLIYGSGVYNIFVSCVATMLAIFMLLYIGVLWKAHALVEENVVKRETLERRIRMLHRAAIIVCSLIITEAASVFYINSHSMMFHYIFASLSSLLGLVIMITHLANREVRLLEPILRKFKCKPKKGEITSEPIKVCSKASGEVENESAPPRSRAMLGGGPVYLEARGIAAGSIDIRDYMNETSTNYSMDKSSVATSARYLPEIRVDHSDDINLENYSTSPRKYQETLKFDTSSFTKRNSPQGYGPDIYGIPDDQRRASFREPTASKFGIMRDTQSQAQDPAQVATAVTPGSSSKMLCSAEIESRLGISAMPDVTLATKTEVPEHSSKTVELTSREHAIVIPDIANTNERKQPDGEEKTPEITITDCENASTGMLDRISHDLDYLLNRTQTNEEV